MLLIFNCFLSSAPESYSTHHQSQTPFVAPSLMVQIPSYSSLQSALDRQIPIKRMIGFSLIKTIAYEQSKENTLTYNQNSYFYILRIRHPIGSYRCNNSCFPIFFSHFVQYIRKHKGFLHQDVVCHYMHLSGLFL